MGQHQVKTMLACDCCRKTVALIEAKYDRDLEEFVCGDCWHELGLAREFLVEYGLTHSLGVKMEHGRTTKLDK